MVDDELQKKAAELLDAKKGNETAGQQAGSLIEQAKTEREKMEKVLNETRAEVEKLEKLKADAIIAGRGQAGYSPVQKSSKEIADEKAFEIGQRLRGWK